MCESLDLRSLKFTRVVLISQRVLLNGQCKLWKKYATRVKQNIVGVSPESAWLSIDKKQDTYLLWNTMTSNGDTLSRKDFFKYLVPIALTVPYISCEAVPSLRISLTLELCTHTLQHARETSHTVSAVHRRQRTYKISLAMNNIILASVPSLYCIESFLFLAEYTWSSLNKKVITSLLSRFIIIHGEQKTNIKSIQFNKSLVRKCVLR